MADPGFPQFQNKEIYEYLVDKGRKRTTGTFGALKCYSNNDIILIVTWPLVLLSWYLMLPSSAPSIFVLKIHYHPLTFYAVFSVSVGGIMIPSNPITDVGKLVSVQ